MTPEKQRIAIAEACGWTCCGIVQGLNPHGLPPWIKLSDYTTRQVLNHELPIDTLPDYLGNLNAMHEARKSLTELQKAEYARTLKQLTWSSEQPEYCSLDATAKQEAEAFLRTIGKWEDEQ